VYGISKVNSIYIAKDDGDTILWDTILYRVPKYCVPT
jgi:hypothetical protein